ncbi:MAG TPA: helix-turn-helix domain-containing protein [Longimicrobiales bacterium]|nr:helix-turn-helix domain-containing protein [Longimicrobiales bacterium]
MLPVEIVREPARAELLLHPLRNRILVETREPASASEVARRLGEGAQKVGYHVNALVDAGFLLPAGERRVRNLVERRYRATARRYALAPEVLGTLGLTPPGVAEGEAFSAARLLGLTALVQEEVAASVRQAVRGPGPTEDPDRIPTLSLDVELAFDSRAARARFAAELEDAVATLARRYAPPTSPDPVGPVRRLYRLVVGCYPLPRAAAGAAPTPED